MEKKGERERQKKRGADLHQRDGICMWKRSQCCFGVDVSSRHGCRFPNDTPLHKINKLKNLFSVWFNLFKLRKSIHSVTWITSFNQLIVHTCMLGILLFYTCNSCACGQTSSAALRWNRSCTHCNCFQPPFSSRVLNHIARHHLLSPSLFLVRLSLDLSLLPLLRSLLFSLICPYPPFWHRRQHLF